MRTFNFLVLIFFVIIAIKISIQLELILIRLKHFHVSKNKVDARILQAILGESQKGKSDSLENEKDKDEVESSTEKDNE